MPGDVPAWPAWMAAAALGVAYAAASLATLVVVLVLSFGGIDDATPAGVLPAAAAAGAATLAGTVRLARTVADPRPEHFGIRPTSLRLGLAGLGVGLVAVVLLALLAQVVGHPFSEPSIPRELSAQTPFARASHQIDLTAVDPGPAAAASLAARAVVAVVAAEVLLRGFVLPALAGWAGTPGAVVVTALLFGAFGGIAAGTEGLWLPALALGVVLGWLYLETQSIVPGVGVACAASGAALAAGLGWTTLTCAATGALCALGGLALVLPLALGRPAAAEVPGGPTGSRDLRPSAG